MDRVEAVPLDVSARQAVAAELLAEADDVLHHSARLRERARLLRANARELVRTAARISGVPQPE